MWNRPIRIVPVVFTAACAPTTQVICGPDAFDVVDATSSILDGESWQDLVASGPGQLSATRTTQRADVDLGDALTLNVNAPAGEVEVRRDDEVSCELRARSQVDVSVNIDTVNFVDCDDVWLLMDDAGDFSVSASCPPSLTSDHPMWATIDAWRRADGISDDKGWTWESMVMHQELGTDLIELNLVVSHGGAQQLGRAGAFRVEP